MQSVNNVQHWIEAGNDFLWLQKPGEENVTCYNLGGLTNHLDNESVLICPFDANSPFIFKVDSKVSTQVPALSGLKISSNPDIETNGSTSKQAYVTQIESALSAIQSNQLKKVVMAQTHWLDNIQIDPVSAFQHACESNDTYNYLARVNGEVWIGSSPELFLKTDYQTSETVALAGTRLRTNQDEVWGDKEVQEQSIVGTYLLDTFNQMGFFSYNSWKVIHQNRWAYSTHLQRHYCLKPK